MLRVVTTLALISLLVQATLRSLRTYELRASSNITPVECIIQAYHRTKSLLFCKQGKMESVLVEDNNKKQDAAVRVVLTAHLLVIAVILRRHLLPLILLPVEVILVAAHPRHTPGRHLKLKTSRNAGRK